MKRREKSKYNILEFSCRDEPKCLIKLLLPKFTKKPDIFNCAVTEANIYLFLRSDMQQ